MPQGQRVTAPDGTVHLFPAEATPEQIAQALGLKQEPARTLGGDLLDVAKGYGKGLLRIGSDVGDLMNRGAYSVLVPTKVDDALKPTNQRQQAGAFGADVASMIPIGGLSRSARAVPAVAETIERVAVPGLGKKGAQQVLERGMGRATAANAKALYDEKLADEAAHAASGIWKDTATYRSPISQASWAMKQASDANTRFTPMDLASILSGGSLYGLGGKTAGTALALGKLASKPIVGSTLAQGLHSAAPAMQAVGGGGLGLVAEQVLRRLFGGSE